ncbi:G-protein-signaling modulator 2-like [Protopterus annectens]|uniref:G-protein-signaling modulator 2-like n=1 Tax=Protopterus annectens TaxID=7888 RepID=UPI001CF99969|nr:G-protein-signaling modulator 2-like [Protopterus annectens]
MENLMEMVAVAQSRRLDDQRATCSHLPGFDPIANISSNGKGLPQGKTCCYLCMKDSRTFQASPNAGELPKEMDNSQKAEEMSSPVKTPEGVIVPEDDCFSLINRIHSKQLEKNLATRGIFTKNS